jgi:DNA primase
MPDWLNLRALKQAVSMEAVLAYYRVPGLRRYRNQLTGCCPIHHGKRNDSFRASLSKNVFHCFACQAGGTVLDFVAAMERCSILQAALRLQRWFGTGSQGSTPMLIQQFAWNEERVRERAICNPPLPLALTDVNPSHLYLTQRGIDRTTAIEFGVGFYAGPGLPSGRIVIPIGNACGEVVAYAGRAVNGRLPKYKLPAGFRKALEVFNLHRASATGSRTVIVVEGYFDCLLVH